MSVRVVKHTSTVTWRRQNFLSPSAWARHPQWGVGLMVVSVLAFGLLTWLVKSVPAVSSWDLAVLTRLHDWAKGQPLWVSLPLRGFSAFGRDGVMLMLLILAVGWGIRGAERELGLLVLGVPGSELLFQVIGSLVQRVRPEFKDPFENLIGFGYPSGHASTNLVFVALILYLLLPNIRSRGRRAWAIFLGALYVGIVCFSRLFLGLHYPTDILAGLILGVGWSAFTLTVYERYWWKRRAAI